MDALQIVTLVISIAAAVIAIAAVVIAVRNRGRPARTTAGQPRQAGKVDDRT